MLIIFAAGALGLLEALCAIHGIALPDKILALIFYMHLAWRMRHQDDLTLATFAWPLHGVLFGWILKDQWIYRARTGALKRAAKSFVVQHFMKHPLLAYARFRRAMRAIRWIVWCLPLARAISYLKTTLARWWALREQRRRRLQTESVVNRVAKMRTLTPDAAARLLQSATRRRAARRHVQAQRRSTQILAKWATHRIGAAVQRRRAALQAQADARPLLIRPDSAFMQLWKGLMVGCVVLEMVGMALDADAEDGTMDGTRRSQADTLGEVALRLWWPECVPHTVIGPREWRRMWSRNTRIAATLPAHCAPSTGGLSAGAIDVHALSLHGARFRISPLAVVLSLLGALIETLAVADTLVEYFVGDLDRSTGVLVPKSALSRYVLPPHSLLFHILFNPALPNTCAAFTTLALHANSNHLWRAIFYLQPCRPCAEAWLAPRLRRSMRRHAQTFNSLRDGVGLAGAGASGLWTRPVYTSVRARIEAKSTQSAEPPHSPSFLQAAYKLSREASSIAGSLVPLPTPAPGAAQPSGPVTGMR